MHTHVQVAFGNAGLNATKSFDILMLTLWLCTGASLFGQSIGNISSYLSYSRKEDLEFGEHVGQFTDIFSKYNIDDKLQNLILKETNEYYSNIEDRDLAVRGKVLSNAV